MTFCRMCGKLLQNVRFDQSEIVLCQKCADTMKGELVRVVRCKDCKYGEETINAKGEQMIKCGGEFPDWLRYPDWFCADGEKRTD